MATEFPSHSENENAVLEASLMQPFNLTVYVPSIWVSPSNDTAICSAPSELVLSITEQLAVLFSSAYPSMIPS